MSGNVQNFPNCRFGQFEAQWDKKVIGEFIKSYRGGAPLKPTDFVKTGTHRVLPKKAIVSGGKLAVPKEITYCSDKFYERNLNSVISSEYLITTLRDLVPTGPTIGFVVEYQGSVNYLLAQGVYGILINEKNLDRRFFIQFSNTSRYRKWMRKIKVGSTQVHIRMSDFKRVPFYIPVFEEQQKIAAFLSSIDTKIEQLSKKKFLLEQYKKGMMQKLFSREIRFKDEHGGEYPDWEYKRLGELYEITSSKRVFQSEWKDSGIPFYRAREIIELGKNGTVDNDLFISPEMYKKYSEKYGVPKENDLLVTGVGTIGKLYVVPKNSNFYFKDGNIVWFKNMNRVSSNYIKYSFNSRYVEKQLLDNASITTVATYTIESANKTKVLIPALQEQQKIAAFLSAIDKKIELVAEQLKQAQTFKKGLLQQMFV